MDVVYYVTGHQDDAFLFRGEVLYADLHRIDTKVVHVVTTAGDAGRTDGWWEAREHGALAGVMATLSPAHLSSSAVQVSTGSATHTISRYTCENSHSYFLRLPDGNTNNSGFPSTGQQTLSKLRDGEIGSLSAVDGSEVYTGWDDFRDTLRAILTLERGGATNPRPWINASDYDRAADPNDHPDHYATADALRMFAEADGYQRLWWVSYRTQELPPNLHGFALDTKRLLFYAYGYGIQRQIGEPPNDTEWAWWGAKSYSREERVRS